MFLSVAGGVWSDNKISSNSNLTGHLANIVKVVFTKMETCFSRDWTARVGGETGRETSSPSLLSISHKEFPMHYRRVQ